MKPILTSILSLCFITQAYAQDTRNWIVSGNDLKFNLSANDTSQNLLVNPHQLNAQAQGYITAIMDSQEWCLKGQILPHDVYDRVFAHLDSLEAQDLTSNASLLVKDALQTYCKP